VSSIRGLHEFLERFIGPPSRLETIEDAVNLRPQIIARPKDAVVEHPFLTAYFIELQVRRDAGNFRRPGVDKLGSELDRTSGFIPGIDATADPPSSLENEYISPGVDQGAGGG
jgi:hypothetical protein